MMRTETRHIVASAGEPSCTFPPEIDARRLARPTLEWIYCIVDHWALCTTVPYKQGYKVLGVYATVDKVLGQDALWEWRSKNAKGVLNGGHRAKLEDAKHDAVRWFLNNWQDWPPRSGEPSIKAIVREWLVCNGYSGLYNPDEECGCGLEDLMPCGEYGSSCVAGYAYHCELCTKAETCKTGWSTEYDDKPYTTFAAAGSCEPDYREEGE